MTIILNADFALCVGDMEANTISETDNTGDGMFVLCGYCATGGGVITYDDTGSLSVEADNYYNIEELRGKKLTLHNANNFSRWISINPIPENNNLIPTFYKGPLSTTLPASNNTKKIVVVEGTANVDSKSLKELSIGRLGPGKELSLNLEANCAVIILEKV